MSQPRRPHHFARPAHGERVRSGYREGWRGVDSAWKSAHAVGRTVVGLYGSLAHTEAEALREEMDFPISRVGGERAWSSMSPTQRLDCLATHLLATERRELREANVFGWDRSWLSPNQSWVRSWKEVPMDPKALELLILNPRVRPLPLIDSPCFTPEATTARRRLAQRVKIRAEIAQREAAAV